MSELKLKLTYDELEEKMINDIRYNLSRKDLRGLAAWFPLDEYDDIEIVAEEADNTAYYEAEKAAIAAAFELAEVCPDTP